MEGSWERWCWGCRWSSCHAGKVDDTEDGWAGGSWWLWPWWRLEWPVGAYWQHWGVARALSCGTLSSLLGQ